MIIRNKKTGEIKEVSMNELNQYGLGGNIYKSGGEMIKRADGSYSRRGLWDNIRANAGSGKRPTKEMLNQERKIKNQHQAEYGMEVMGNGGLIKYKEKGEVINLNPNNPIQLPNVNFVYKRPKKDNFPYNYTPQNLVPPSFNNLGQTTYSEITPIDVKKAEEDYKNKVIKTEAYVNKQNANAIEFHTKWMNSPMYKEMLYKSDPINAETIEKNRWVNFNNINSNFNPIQRENWAAASNPFTGNIQIYPIAVQNDVPGIGPHEFSHSIDSPKGFWNSLILNRNIPNTDENKMYSYSGVSNFSVKPNPQKEWIYKNDPRFYKYVAEPTETRARLNEIRNSAYENNLYDPFTQKVDVNKFNKLLEFEKNQIFNPLWELQHVYTDDQIIDLLNTVSMNNKLTNLNIAKNGGQKMPPKLAYARFAAAGNLNQLSRYGYQDGGDIPTIEGPSGYMNEDNVWVVDNETIKRQAQELGAKKVLTEGGSLIIFDDNWNIVAADDNPDAPYKQGGSVTLNTGGENHRIYVKTTNRGEGEKGHIMVNHPTMDKGMWDTIDLTQKSGATTIAQGVAATKKWHRENPYMKEYGGDVDFIPNYKLGGAANYTVKRGETLGGIAKKNTDISYTKLAKLNNIKNPDYIQAGQNLYVPYRKSNVATNVIPILLRPVQQPQIKPFNVSDLLPKTTKQQVVKNQPVKPKINTTQPVNKKSIPIENNKKEIKKVDKNIKTVSLPKSNNNVVNQYNITSSDANESNMYSNRSYVGKVDRVVPDRPTLIERAQGIWDGINQRFISSRQEEDKEAIVKKPLPKSKIKHGYKELYTVRDMKGGAKDSLLASTYTGDNDTGTVFKIGNMVANLNNPNQSFENVEGVAHFIMDGDVLPNQMHTEPYYDARGQLVRSNVPGKFINFISQDPNAYNMYYKPTGKPNTFNVVYKQNKFGKPYLDKGWLNDLTVRSVPYSNIDWEGQGPSTGFFTKSNYIPLKNNMGATSIPYKNKSGYSRFSGGSGIYIYKDPITNREIQTNVTGSPETLKQIGESIINKNNIDPNTLTFLYHDMGSYSAKPKARPNGTLNYNQWRNYNTYNRGRSGAPIMIPRQEYGGNIPMYGPGGQNLPTRSDSLFLLNNNKIINKLKTSGLYLDTQMERVDPKKWESTYNFKRKQLDDIITQDIKRGSKKGKPSQYKDVKGDFVGTQDWMYGGHEDVHLPKQYIHPKIAPQFEGDFYPKNSSTLPLVYSYMYDDLAITPMDMLTPAQQKLRLKKYPPVKQTQIKPQQTINTTKDKVTTSVRTKDNLERMEMTPMRPLDIPIGVPHGELLPIRPKQTVNLGNLTETGTHPVNIYDRRGNFLRIEYTGDADGVVDHNYAGKRHYAHWAHGYLDLTAPIKEVEKRSNGGGIPMYGPGGEETKWYYPKEVITNERPYYYPPTETLYLNPDYNNEPEIVRQHELFHHLQKINGGAQRPEYYPGPLKKPNMMMNDDLQGAYWNRKTVDVNNLMDQVIKRNPDFQFYPNDLFYNKVIDGLEYDTPGTLENEAQQYEDYVRNGGKPLFTNGGGIPERYRNMGFTNVGAKRQSTRPGKKWMVLAKKGDDYKVVHGGYKGMQDFKQHHSEQRKENFWSRMGGRNSSKATDPFSPLYWHKRFGTWEYGGQPMAVGGQNVMNPIVKKDNRNWLEYLKN